MSAVNTAIVLVEPREAGNIGAAARAMHNMGLERLVLVRPQAFLVPQAYRMALDGRAILEGAEVHTDLPGALEKFEFVVGTTRRTRSITRETVAPRSAAAEMIPLGRQNRCAVLFGREDRGLTNEEIELCHRLVTIPTSNGAESLNLAQSVLVMAYELLLASHMPDGRDAVRGRRKRAASSDLERFYGHMETTLLKIGYLNTANPKRMMRVFREIFARSGLDGREVRALRGIFRQLDWYAREVEEGPVRRGAARPADQSE